MSNVNGINGVAGGRPPLQRGLANAAGPLAGRPQQANLAGGPPPWVQPRRQGAGVGAQQQRAAAGAQGGRPPARPFDPRNPRANLPPRHQPPFPLQGQRPVFRVPGPNNGMGHRIAREIERVVGELGLAPEPVMQRLTGRVNEFNRGVQMASLGVIPPGGWLGRFLQK